MSVGRPGTAPQPLPPSLYAATARPGPATPPLEGDHTVSVAVIGGGFTGLSTALHLAEQGVDVAVLEAHEPGWGASGRNGGQVNPGLKHDPSQVEADFGPELGDRMIRFAWSAPDTLFALIRRWQIQCDARNGGTIRAAVGEAAAVGVRRTAEDCIRRGMPVTVLDQDAARDATGCDRYTTAMLDRRGGDVQPLDLARGLAAAVIKAGGRVHGGTRALSLRREGTQWHVATPSGTLRADSVVLGGNGYTDDLVPGLRRSLVPVFSSIAATAPLPEAVADVVMPSGSVLYESGRITVYLRQDRSNRLLIGGRGPQRPIDDPSPVDYLIRYAERLWPGLRGVTWTHGWNGQLAMTTDHYPHVHEPAPGLFACLGYNGRGVALATAMGAEITRRVMRAPQHTFCMPTSPIRPIRFHGLWRVGVAARVLEGRILDRLGL